MGKIVIFAGTTEGRELSEWLSSIGAEHIVCVATEYGKQVLVEDEYSVVMEGRMDEQQIEKFFEENDTAVVVDATHPYAVKATENIRMAALKKKVEYLRLERQDIEIERQNADSENTERADNKDVKHDKDVIESKESNDTKKYSIEDVEIDKEKLSETINKRIGDYLDRGFGVRYFENIKECEERLEKTHGNIMLTTGSKELADFCVNDSVKERLVVRVLPGSESISICEKCGIKGKQIIAMQGPFSIETNFALINQYNIRIMVTKASGAAGGFEEKIDAARLAGIRVYVIGRPQEQKGLSFEEVCEKLAPYIQVQKYKDYLTVLREKRRKPRKITLIGCGMGKTEDLSQTAMDVIKNANMVFGSRRLVESLNTSNKKYPYYLAGDVIPILLEGIGDVAILFSGDTGFYSGAKKMYEELEKKINSGILDAKITIIPGVSSISALSAKSGVSWDDAKIISFHGKDISDNLRAEFVRAVQTNRKCFALLSGVSDLNLVGRILMEEKLEECKVIVGYLMSYPREKIMTLTPKQCIEISEPGLYSIFVINEAYSQKVSEADNMSHDIVNEDRSERILKHVNEDNTETTLKNVNEDKSENRNSENKIKSLGEFKITPGIADSEFVRGKVPMTKEEVRTVSISKLNLNADSVVYDVGSGTGSVAIEIARLSDRIKVFAIEKKHEAVELIHKNIEKFGLNNIQVTEGMAPVALEELPTPTHAFIGGSSGNMSEIVELLLNKNPQINIVINAVSLETLQEIMLLDKKFELGNFDIVTMNVTRTEKVGDYHMMRGQNPIFICSFSGRKTKEMR
ncbi:MAG: precorrin-6y C5,15-methyltransferase (decarboxylating) subunit CbiE [Lachnospiraceae bacterium]|nr:precorrin-6y C5,15-methyltransferase (decarboxylating) subunit CbiE [Lachnospiraceae bacterium]